MGHWSTDDLGPYQHSAADAARSEQYAASLRDRFQAAGVDPRAPMVVEACAIVAAEMLTRMTAYAVATDKPSHQDAVLELGQEVAGEIVLALIDLSENVPSPMKVRS